MGKILTRDSWVVKVVNKVKKLLKSKEGVPWWKINYDRYITARRIYIAKNAKKLKADNRRWHRKNKEKVAERKHLWYLSHREQVLEHKRKYLYDKKAKGDTPTLEER